MDHAKYKVLVHNDLQNGKVVPQNNPLGYTPTDEKQIKKINCEVCGDQLEVIIYPQGSQKPGGLSSLAFYVLLVLVAIIGGVIAAFATSNTIIGVLISVLILIILLIIFGEKEDIKLTRRSNMYLEKEQINKKHVLKTMSPEFAEKEGIDPYKTF